MLSRFRQLRRVCVHIYMYVYSFIFSHNRTACSYCMWLHLPDTFQVWDVLGNKAAIMHPLDRTSIHGLYCMRAWPFSLLAWSSQPPVCYDCRRFMQVEKALTSVHCLCIHHNKLSKWHVTNYLTVNFWTEVYFLECCQSSMRSVYILIQYSDESKYV